MNILKQHFNGLLKKYTECEALMHQLWSEIQKHYSDSERHYHNLQHLGHILKVILPVKDKIKNWDALLFTLYYHDIIYNPLKFDNEEKSAHFAVERLKRIGIPNETILKCNQQILATKSHAISDSKDTNYFNDADLSILGQNAQIYAIYCKSLRKEYAAYSDDTYRLGRRKVLLHFLQMQQIFKTPYFFNQFENSARTNLKAELQAINALSYN